MDESLISRREVTKRILLGGMGVAAGSGLLSACQTLEPTTCAPPPGEHPGVGWGPSIFAPVFHGFADYTLANGDAVRMYYPSVESRASCAQVLGGTAARFPLVLFMHGDCTPEPNHYLQWAQLPSILARSGFVVAVPNLSPIGHPGNPQSTSYTRAAATLTWARTEWPYKHLLFSTVTGLIGHSWGALHSQQIATDTNPTAFVSLSGQQADFSSSPPQPTCPKLFVFGTGENASFGLSDAQWNAFQGERHRLVLSGLHHFDYAPPSTNTCGSGLFAQCGQYHRIAADLIALFLSRYMSSEHSGILDDFIPANLVLNDVVRTPAQEAFASGWLASLAETVPDCSATLSWSVPGDTGERTIP